MLRKWASHWFEFILVIVILGFHIYAAVLPANNMMGWYSSDDAFYYFKTAQNISQGYGSTFDQINQTNGYHPLWLAMLVPVFSLARYDLVLPLRILIVVLGAMNAVSAVLLYRLVRGVLSKEIGMLAAAFWAFSPFIHGMTVENGVESGINVLTILWFVYLIARWETRKTNEDYHYQDLLGIGFAGVLVFLSRLDNVFLVGLTGLWLLFRTWTIPEKDRLAGSSPWRNRINVAMRYFLPIGITLVGYMLINYLAFGTPTPVSGQIKRWWGTLNNSVYGYPADNFWVYLSNMLTRDSRIGPWAMFINGFHTVVAWIEGWLKQSIPQLPDENKWLHRGLVFAVGLLFSGGSFWVVRSNWKMVKNAVIKFALIPIFLGCIIQFTSYKITPYVATKVWYWVSELVVTVLVLSILLEGIHQILKRVHIHPRALQAAALLLTVLLFVRFERMMVVNFPWEEDPQWHNAFLWGAQGLEKATEPGAVIGTPGGGSLGYFIQGRTIVNLDGLINSYTYFQMLKQGKASVYLNKIGLKYVYGNEYMLIDSDPYWTIFKHRVVYMEKIVGTNLYQYRPDLIQVP
jgi:hypothetical protein